MNRPYLQNSVDELERLFEHSRAVPDVLEDLTRELGHRKAPRAKKLNRSVQEALLALRAAAAQPTATTSHDAVPKDQVPSDSVRGCAERVPAILDAWTALEVLSPKDYKKPEEFVGGQGQRDRVAALRRGALPWENGGEASPQGQRLYYQALLGDIRLEPAYAALQKRYAEDFLDPPTSKPLAPLAVVVCDRRGVPQEDTASVSSFGWGLPLALEGKLAALGRWNQEMSRLNANLFRHLCERDERGDPLPLTREKLAEVREWLVRTLRLSPEIVQPPSFVLRDPQHRFEREVPEPLLLNSFFLRDLARARAAFEAGEPPFALARYLGAIEPRERHDLLREGAALSDLLAPERTPLARWPGPRRASLVTLQQAAVNAATGSQPGSLIAVNGPPGTGKTTLLRDVVAAVLCSRAEVLASFDDPEKAFSRTGISFSRGSAKFELRAISPSLRGFEMVVASSNNKAVENVSAELPALRAVAADAPGLRYFASVAEAVNEQPCWGLAAAVLGNASNTYRFQQAFWADEDRGLEPYLAVAAGTPRVVTDPDGTTRPPEVVRRECPPSGRVEALAQWRAARERFARALDASRSQRASLQEVHRLETEIRGARERLGLLDQRLRELQQAFGEAQAAYAQAVASAQAARERFAVTDQVRQAHGDTRPNPFARLVRTSGARAWRSEAERLDRERSQATEMAERAEGDREQAQRRILAIERERADSLERKSRESERLPDLAMRLAEATRALRAPTGEQVAGAPHAEKQQATAWFDSAAQRNRDALFEESIALHKAFVAAAAEPLRHNLAALMRQLWTGVPGARPEHLRDLWASFCLVVPLFSTTFASVERMFRSLGPGSLGWLLLDEAGQATPQSAVGAIFRAERVVVVGDPLQVEPVVSLPAPLTRGICTHFGLDALDVGAPDASVQTLADRASPYTASFETREGTRQVGLPLLVHRRCEDPMFGISNAVAYENLMVKATPHRETRIGSILGASAWIHIEGRAAGHWCPEEGEVLTALLRKLAQGGAAPDFYVVTPFRSAAEGARVAIGQARELRPWLGDVWRFSHERVGTIHMVQGREAEAVIFVLGAPDPRQASARAWAGRTPNLLNVAVTRAKERLYVIGNRKLWRSAGCFELLDRRLPAISDERGRNQDTA